MVAELVIRPFQFTSRKFLVRVPMKLEVPKRHVLRPTLFNDMVQWVFVVGRGKRGANDKAGAHGIKMCYNKKSIISFWGGEKKR